MYAEIISIGNEILCGKIIDTNSHYITNKLRKNNFFVKHISAVGDNESELVKQLKEAYKRSRIIITTGGLGPTEDDITFQSIGRAFNLNLVKYPEAEKHINKMLHRINTNISKSNLKQAYLPEGSKCIINEYGTAPAIILEVKNRIIVSLPGVPLEMKKLLSDKIIPFLCQKFPNQKYTQSRIVRISGLGESSVNEKIKNFIHHNRQLDIGIYANPEDIQIQLNAIANKPEETEILLDNATRELRNLLGNYIFGINQQTLEEVVGILLKKNKFTISVAESCTGGMLGGAITSVSGSSDYFKGGIISYDGEIKEKLLGISKDIMIQYGQVSDKVAGLMAEGVRKKCHSDIGLGITGIAGPNGGSKEKPVGLVYIALSDGRETIVQKHHLFKDRQAIRLRAVRRTLNMLRLYLINQHNNK